MYVVQHCTTYLFMATEEKSLTHGGTGRRERKRQQTRDHLADTAWEMFEARGFEAVTMESIGHAADVATGTLYTHFPSKEHLLRHRLHREMERMLPAVLGVLAEMPTASERLRGFLAHCTDWSERYRQYLPHYLRHRLQEPSCRGGLEPQDRSGLDRVFAAFIEEGQRRGEFQPEVDATVLATHLEFLYLSALLRWLTGQSESLGAEFETVLHLFLNGLSAKS